MAVSNTTLLEEIKINRARMNELAASIVDCGTRVVALETWRNGHEKNAHVHIQQQIEAAVRIQERQGTRIWEIALKVAEIGTLLIAITKLSGIW